ncbi:ROK family transcriptional regulator [Micromonospora deserti]|uniref:Sugar kinase n=1 Tax=Micromonospora deserti TaxID=2070366 RepID=A0A2W2CPN4_9ACTN|nr:ROK family transcriptional regulator [Micromonospora deserti]PZG01476.1 sugar kinase [Micromonospora deserti]
MNERRTPVQDVRRLHRGMVLRSLRDGGPQPRAELARRLGLSATTMTKVVGQLLDEGVVIEAESEGVAARVGRPSVDVRLKADARQVIGIHVGAGAVQLGLCDLTARAGHTSAFTYDLAERPERVAARVVDAAIDLLARAGLPRGQLLGVGVAAPGPVDPAHRVNVLSVNLGWRDVPFSDILERELGAATVVDHNVRSMALAEARYGKAAGVDPLLYVHVRFGLGAGVVIGGQPFRSGPYGVTELGHLRVVEKGRRCACGAVGCLETVVSEPYLVEQLATVLGQESTRPMRDLARLADGGDERAVSILDDLVDYLTTGLASAVNLLNPELIVLGGIFDAAPDTVFDKVRSVLHDKAFPILRDVVRVDRSTFGINAGVVGSAAVALDRFFYNP